jgi:ATP-dependent exoDNAse (exonuclease V) alpha subunit
MAIKLEPETGISPIKPCPRDIKGVPITQAQALSILKSGANVFLTGGPGSGKTHTINEYVAYLRHRGVETAITASTGIAATHIGGMTIHSWSGIGIKTKLDKYILNKIASSQYINRRIRRAKVLIIEEVSMLTSDTLSMVDAVCREIKQHPEPFGGMQVVFAGDFFQLPPVVRREAEKSMQTTLIERSSALFAYDSPTWAAVNPIVCYLTEQHRQNDSEYLAILSAIRRNVFDGSHLRHLETRKVEHHTAPNNIPKLFSHNADVDRVNDEILAKLPGESRAFTMFSQGPNALVATLRKGCLSPEALYLKFGAAVMFTKNNPKEGFVNGTLGIVKGFDKTNGNPLIEVRNGRQIRVGPMDWTVEENGKVRAQISQLPLRLAWAITVHKSQGMSLDGAMMDLSNVFEFGQGYVALSRVRQLSGLYILGWNQRAFQVHPEILTKDEDFQRASRDAATIFSNLSPIELQRGQDHFVNICGGKLKPTKQSGFKEIRKTYPNAYRPWNEEQDRKLRELFAKDSTGNDLANIFGRKRGAIRSRLIKLGLLEE